MKGKIPSRFGEVEVSEKVIAEYAGNAAVSCFGIVGMAAVPMSGKGLARLLRKESYHKGINVQIKDNRISLDFHVIVAYGVSIKGESDGECRVPYFSIYRYGSGLHQCICRRCAYN